MLLEPYKVPASPSQCNGTKWVDRRWNLRRRFVSVLTPVIKDLEDDGAVQENCT